MTNTTQPQGVLAEHLAAVNRFDAEAIMATFAPDALVNDNRREFWGTEQIRDWVDRELVGDHVRIEPVQTLEHHDLTIVRGRYDGDYDKTGLPDELILSNYFTIADGLITSLLVIHNR
jgi:ketosteroid isomerase-like protein